MHTDLRPRSTIGTFRRRTTRLLAAVATVAAAGAALPATSAVAATVARVGYQGHAFGTYVTVNGTVRSGPSSVSALGCGAAAGYRSGNSAATSSIPATVAASNIVTTGSTAASPDRSATTSRAANVSVLGGRITGTVIKAVSISTHDSSGYHTSAEGMTFTDLKVLGVPVASSPPPNTTIELPGVGHVVLNEQHPSVTATSASMTVYAVHAYVDEASPSGAPVGTNAIVAGAFSAIAAPTAGFFSGGAYGTQAQVGSTLRSGPSFPVALPCAGTTNRVLSNTGSGVAVPTYLSSGTITNTARGVATATTATGQTTSTVSSASLLNGLVRATLIKADAHASRPGGPTILSDAGSSFGSITVNGKTLSRSVAPNTVVQISGVGTLYLRREIQTSTSIEIRMIELVVTKANPFALPVGTDLRVAVASVGAH